MLLNLSEAASQQLEQLAKKMGRTYPDVVESAINQLADVQAGKLVLFKPKEQAKQPKVRRRLLLDDEP
jgi:hypothetical protein